MRAARILGPDARLEPFADPIGRLPLCGSTVEGFRERELQAARVDPDRLTFATHALATAPVLSALVRAAGARPGAPRALALPRSPGLEALTPVSSVRRAGDLLVYDVFVDAPPGADLEALRGDARPLAVDLPLPVAERPLPRIGPGPHRLALPAAGVLAAHVEHWVHLLWLSPLLVPRALALSPGALRRPRRLAPSRVDRGARIHPSAIVEGSVIGAGAEIGAGAVVRHSLIGPGARLADFTRATRCVLEDAPHTLADATFEDVVSLGRGTLSSLLLRHTLLGRDVFLTTGVIFWSESLDRTATVVHRGAEVDTGRHLLGGCAGDGCVLGARTIVAPGRALPAGTTVVMRREEAVTRVAPVAPGTPLCWGDGALLPATEVLPGYAPDELDDGALPE